MIHLTSNIYFFEGETFNKISFLLTLLGLVLSIGALIKRNHSFLYFYQIDNLSFLKTESQNSFSKNHNNVSATLLSIKMRKIVRIRYFFFNKGRKPITKNDIVDGLPLRVKFTIGENKILEVRKRFQSSASNNVQLDFCTDNILCINFDYLDKNEGFVIDIFNEHDFNSLPEVSCITKSSGMIKKISPSTFISFNFVSSYEKLYAFALLFFPLFSLFYLFIKFYFTFNGGSIEYWFTLSFFGAGLLILITWIKKSLFTVPYSFNQYRSLDTFSNSFQITFAEYLKNYYE